MLNDHKISLLI